MISGVSKNLVSTIPYKFNFILMINSLLVMISGNSIYIYFKKYMKKLFLSYLNLFRLEDYDFIDDFFCNVIIQNQKCYECLYE